MANIIKPLYNQEDDKVRQALFNLNNWANIVNRALQDLPDNYTIGKAAKLTKGQIGLELRAAITLLRDRYYNFLDTL